MWKNYLKERETERLIIRPVRNSDSQEWKEFVMDELATRYFPDEWKMQEEKAIEWIEGQQTRCKEGRYGLQALIDKKTGKLLGLCGLLLQDVDGVDELEIGYHLIRKYWGNGYATEAAIEYKKMCFENNLADSIISIIDKDNLSSQKVAQRNGMKSTAQTSFMGMDVFIFRINKEDYFNLVN